MPSVNFEIRDVPIPLMSSSMSAAELARLDGRDRTAALQRHFLYVCDVLRKAGVPTDDMIAALLGASIQDFIENAMLKLLEKAQEQDPSYPATLTVLGQFISAQGMMMVNQGIPAGLLGVSMMSAGAVVAMKELSRDKVGEAIRGTLEAVVTGKLR